MPSRIPHLARASLRNAARGFPARRAARRPLGTPEPIDAGFDPYDRPVEAREATLDHREFERFGRQSPFPAVTGNKKFALNFQSKNRPSSIRSRTSGSSCAITDAEKNLALKLARSLRITNQSTQHAKTNRRDPGFGVEKPWE